MKIMTPRPRLARPLSYFGLVVALVSVIGISASSTPVAVAASSQSAVSVYLDAPFIQGSYVTQGVLSESFDFFSTNAACPSTIGVGERSGGRCQVEGATDYGGATAGPTDDTPTVGGSGSNYASTNDDGLVITFATDQRYLGFWWSAGSNGNLVKFYKGSTVLLTLTSNDIIELLGTPPTNDQDWVNRNDDDVENVITSIRTPTSDKYRKMWYFGNPRGYSSVNPTARSTLQSSEPFVYLHMFATGDLTFDKVELSGGGFEFDNLVVSSTVQTPDPRLVLVRTIARDHTVTFDPNGTGVEGTMANQVSNTTTALRVSSFERSGFTFAGWATSADGSGTRYADGANYDFGADLTLYAQWTANSQPSSRGGDVPAAKVPEPTLAATGINGGALLGLSALALVLGLSLVAGARRLRQD
jgi:uncharacterized repeat protein (TIGR02543 family)